MQILRALDLEKLLQLLHANVVSSRLFPYRCMLTKKPRSALYINFSYVGIQLICFINYLIVTTLTYLQILQRRFLNTYLMAFQENSVSHKAGTKIAVDELNKCWTSGDNVRWRPSFSTPYYTSQSANGVSKVVATRTLKDLLLGRASMV